jgi:hypothetical protein
MGKTVLALLHLTLGHPKSLLLFGLYFITLFSNYHYLFFLNIQVISVHNMLFFHKLLCKVIQSPMAKYRSLLRR